MVADFKDKKKRAFPAEKFFWGVACVFVLIVSIMLISFDVKMYGKKKELNSQVSNLKKQIQEIEDRNEILKQGIASVNDQDYIEKVAREDLGMQKKGENVVSFVTAQEEPKEENKATNFWPAWIIGFFQWLKSKF